MMRRLLTAPVVEARMHRKNGRVQRREFCALLGIPNPFPLWKVASDCTGD